MLIFSDMSRAIMSTYLFLNYGCTKALVHVCENGAHKIRHFYIMNVAIRPVYYNGNDKLCVIIECSRDDRGRFNSLQTEFFI